MKQYDDEEDEWSCLSEMDADVIEKDKCKMWLMDGLKPVGSKRVARCFHGFSLTVHNPETTCGNCVLGPWRILEPCSVSCGTGTLRLLQDIDTQAKYETGTCPSEEERTKELSCNQTPCPSKYFPGIIFCYLLFVIMRTSLKA